MSDPAVAYALTRGRLLVPTRLHGRGAAAALATTMLCKPLPLAAHHVAWLAARVGGARAVPGRRCAADDGAPGEFEPVADRTELHAALVAALGPIDCFATIRRRQVGRPAVLALALRDDRPVAFVKAIAADPVAMAAVHNEAAVLQALARHASGAPVVLSRVLAAGDDGGYAWFAGSCLGTTPHRPAWRAPVEAVLAWFRDALRDHWPRDGTPADWVPIHGDFAPWNLRRYARGPLALVDLEDARLGPAEADATYWEATTAVLRGRGPRRPLDVKGAQFWADIVQARVERGDDLGLDQPLYSLLRSAHLGR